MQHLLEKAMATPSSTLAWRIPRMEDPGRLQCMGHEDLDTTEWLHFHFHVLEKEMATHSSVLDWRIPGTEEPGGLPSMGSHRVGHDWSDLAAAAAKLIIIISRLVFCEIKPFDLILPLLNLITTWVGISQIYWTGDLPLRLRQKGKFHMHTFYFSILFWSLRYQSPLTEHY